MRTILLMLLMALAVARCTLLQARGGEGPVLRGPFSLSGEPHKDVPFNLYWHPGKNIASFYLRYREPGRDKFAHFAHIYSLDQDRVVTYYDGFNISFCHEYPVTGQVPARFWHSVQRSGTGKCMGDDVTWYEGKFSTLFVPYGLKRVRIGFNKAEKPTCAEATLWDYKKGDTADAAEPSLSHPIAAMLRALSQEDTDERHKKHTRRFTIDFDDSEPSIDELFPKWLAKKCDNSKAIVDEWVNERMNE